MDGADDTDGTFPNCSDTRFATVQAREVQVVPVSGRFGGNWLITPPGRQPRRRRVFHRGKLSYSRTFACFTEGVRLWKSRLSGASGSDK